MAFLVEKASSYRTRVVKKAVLKMRRRIRWSEMCLAMNPDKLVGDQVCASSSNRNFKGRQGSPTGRTLLMSPAMVAAAALAGEVTDVRTLVQT